VTRYSPVFVCLSCVCVCVGVFAGAEGLRHVHVCTAHHELIQRLLASVRLRVAQYAQGSVNPLLFKGN